MMRHVVLEHSSTHFLQTIGFVVTGSIQVCFRTTLPLENNLFVSAVVDLHNKILDAPPVQILSILCSFLVKFGKILCSRSLEGWRPHLGEILDPPLQRYVFWWGAGPGVPCWLGGAGRSLYGGQNDGQTRLKTVRSHNFVGGQ